MRKLFVLGFLVVAAMGFGCAVTDYDLITDNDSRGVVNTQGKAYIIRDFSTIAFAYPDGNDQAFYMIDQNSAGVANIDTYNYYTTDGGTPYKDDSYCSPDWTGCSIVSATDTNDGSDVMFDYDHFNPNCSGARSLVYLLSTTRYYGECGRATITDRTQKLISLANNMQTVQRFGRTVLHTALNANNLSVVFTNNSTGSTFTPSIISSVDLYLNFGARRASVDFSNPMNGRLFQNVTNWFNQNPGAVSTTFIVDGHDATFNTSRFPNKPGIGSVHF